MGAGRRTLWSSLLVVGLVAAVAGSGVFAVLTDLEVSDQNTLRSGSIDLKLDGGDGATTFAVRDAQHGQEGRGTTRLSNVGRNDGTLNIGVKDGDITNAPGITYESEPTPDRGEMGQVAEMAIFVDMDRDGAFDGQDIGLSAVPITNEPGECVQYTPSTALFEKIDEYEGCAWSDLATLGPDVDFVVLWRIPHDAGNEVQGDQVFVRYTFELNQVES